MLNNIIKCIKWRFFFHKEFFIIFIGLFIFISCSPTRRLTKNEQLLVKNKIVFTNNVIDEDLVNSYVKQKPNRKILGIFQFHLSVYNLVNPAKEAKRQVKRDAKREKRNNKRSLKGKTTKDKPFIKSLPELLLEIGEPPVVLDTQLTDKTVKQLILLSNSKGYFDAAVKRNITHKKLSKKKAIVTYTLTLNQPYFFNHVNYQCNDDILRNIVMADSENCLIRKNQNFDIDILQKERERIVQYLKDNGYFAFSKDYILYEADSIGTGRRINIFLQIKNPVLPTSIKDSVIELPYHKRYFINNIYVYPEYSSLRKDVAINDTLKIITSRNKEPYNFIFNSQMRVKPKIIAQSIFLRNGDLFNTIDLDRTYRRLSDLKIYRSIAVNFVEDTTKGNIFSTYGYLNTLIQMNRAPIQALNVEFEGTNSSGDLGVAGKLVYQNKNFFRSAELFSIKLKGAMEVQRLIGDTIIERIISTLPFNTIEGGIESSLDFPKFLLPVKADKISKNALPKTTIRVGYNYQKRTNYTRYIATAAFGYTWKESARKTHILNPIEINSVKIFPDSFFLEQVQLIKDKKLRSSYEDHLTSATTYSFIYSTQQFSKQKDFIYFRFNLETAGNILQTKNNILKSPKNSDGNYTLFNIQYAEYVRGDIDLRQYFYFSNKQHVALRLLLGLGYAYGNSSLMPFEKSFFAGGANSIRAWLIRSVGPGSYSSDTRFDKTGDVLIETNAEYRFPLYKFLHGAFFVDVGNIWLNYQSSKFPGGTFYFDKFYNELAAGGGFGTRFDFSFFILRLDGAVPLHNPALPVAHRWIDKSISLKDINFNLGIGYPF